MNRSVDFFDHQFQRQIAAGAFDLNPFEQAVLPHLTGRVLDFGCGLGNLSIAAARQGCSVLALDAAPHAVAHLAERARREGLSIEARQADLGAYVVAEKFDCAAAIGLLMFFDCATAARQLRQLQTCVKAGGVVAINVLIDGTTYLDMFDPDAYCLLDADALRRNFDGWHILHDAIDAFPAPDDTVKRFATLVAHKPGPVS